MDTSLSIGQGSNVRSGSLAASLDNISLTAASGGKRSHLPAQKRQFSGPLSAYSVEKLRISTPRKFVRIFMKPGAQITALLWASELR
jgi:hypothetical protein